MKTDNSSSSPVLHHSKEEDEVINSLQRVTPAVTVVFLTAGSEEQLVFVS